MKKAQLAAAVVLSFAFSHAAFADESVTSTTTNSGGSSTTNKFKATSGPDGAKVSRTKSSVQANGDGSVSAVKQHESHAVDAVGATHKKSAEATTINPDGSTSSVKSTTKTSNP